VIATPGTTSVPDESRLISKGTHVTDRHFLFDVDDVISQRQSPESVTWLAVTFGMNRSDFATIYSRYRSGYEPGTSRAGCWPRAVGRDIGRDDELLDDLDLQDILSLTRPWVDVPPMLREARANGHDLNLIANVPKPLGSACEESKGSWIFQRSLFSADSGHATPRVQAFGGALEGVGASREMSNTSVTTREPLAPGEVGREANLFAPPCDLRQNLVDLPNWRSRHGKLPGARRRLTPPGSSPSNPQSNRHQYQDH
jgi:hypothetical protein